MNLQTHSNRVIRCAAMLFAVGYLPLVSNAQPTPILLRTVDTQLVAGQLESFSLDRGLRFAPDGGAEPVIIPARDLVELNPVRQEPPAASHADVLALNNADRLIGSVSIVGDDLLAIETALLGILRIPVERLTTWITPLGQSQDWKKRVAAFIDDRNDGKDRVLMINGDEATGVLAATPDGLAIESASGPIMIPMDRVVAAVVFSPETSHPDADRSQLAARITFSDESLLTVESLHWADGKVHLTGLHHAERIVDASRIARIEILRGRWEWLTDRSPISFEQTPTFAIHWPYQVNRNVVRGPLKVAGQSHRVGIGVHSRTSLTYDLQGRCDEFVTAYGLDDDSHSLADVTVKIIVDGQVRHHRESVTPGDLHGPFRVNTSRANHLELVVDFGKFGGVGDRFNWIEPAFISPPQP